MISIFTQPSTFRRALALLSSASFLQQGQRRKMPLLFYPFKSYDYISLQVAYSASHSSHESWSIETSGEPSLWEYWMNEHTQEIVATMRSRSGRKVESSIQNKSRSRLPKPMIMSGDWTDLIRLRSRKKLFFVKALSHWEFFPIIPFHTVLSIQSTQHTVSTI